jgi:two-component system sensor histidine kinase MtrB
VAEPSTPRPLRVPRVAFDLRSVWGSGLRRVARLVGAARLTWRRSLQLRVVTITLVASSTLVGSFAVVVAMSSTGRLIDGTRSDIRKVVESGADHAAGQLSVHQSTLDPKLPTTLHDTLVYLAGYAPQGGDMVVVIKSKSDTRIKGSWPQTPVDPGAAITPALERRVADDGRMASQIVTRRLTSGDPVKYLVYGAPVRTSFGQVELYYLVPLTTEDKVATRIRNVVLGTGLSLVVLLALLAALVTRLVVNPVRAAARTAQRLSAGLLDQRMRVEGEDDLAKLAASFNQMAANLQRQIERLEELSRLQRRFTSDVSHELRTPLTTVRMAADLLFAERDMFDPAVGRTVELLQNELDRFEGLLSDLLEISRFDAGFAVLDAEPTDLVTVVRRVADRLASVARRAGVEVRVHLPDAPVIAELDSRRVERILRNLVGNAVEHGEGRPVDVTLDSDDSAVAVTVRDRGVGLCPGEEKLVFNRFWRADASRARQTGGSGLGLSISLEDARLHRGWLEAWGAPGDGAQFRLTLPVRAGDRLVASPLPLVPTDLAPHAPRGRQALHLTVAMPGARVVSGDGATAVSGDGAAEDGGGGAAAVTDGDGAATGDAPDLPAEVQA